MAIATMTAEHSARRKQGLGSSDAAAVCGMSKWQSPLHIFMAKKGQYEQADNSAMQWGRMLEDVVAQAYEDHTSRFIRPPAEKVLVHPEHPWMLASLDRQGFVDGQPIVVELKTVGQDSDEWGEPGTDEIPPYYLCQVMHQLAVTGWARADLAALFAHSELRVYTIHRDERLIDTITSIEQDFWSLVEGNLQPAPEWEHPMTPSLIKQCQRITAGRVTEVGWDEQALAETYVRLGKEISEREKERELVQAKLVHAIGDAEFAHLPAGGVIKRKLVNRKGYTVDPTSYTNFHVSMPKEY